jgi:hypothetical protein
MMSRNNTTSRLSECREYDCGKKAEKTMESGLSGAKPAC